MGCSFLPPTELLHVARGSNPFSAWQRLLKSSLMLGEAKYFYKNSENNILQYMLE